MTEIVQCTLAVWTLDSFADFLFPLTVALFKLISIYLTNKTDSEKTEDTPLMFISFFIAHFMFFISQDFSRCQ